MRSLTPVTHIDKNLRTETIELKHPGHTVVVKAIAEKLPPSPYEGHVMLKGFEVGPEYGLKSVILFIKDHERGIEQEMELTDEQLHTLQSALDRIVPFAPPVRGLDTAPIIRRGG